MASDANIKNTANTSNAADPISPATQYLIDAFQRTILFWDVMRERGNAYLEHASRAAPHVLEYAFELVVDGRTLERPVNYLLVRIIPPQGVSVDMRKRPFVVVDPRAGHGPGIGGFKADSEIGVALKAGHPCYFVGFLPNPMPGQTIEDIGRAEAVFLERIAELHPEAEAKPCVIGNCQAGWALMMLAALRPELFGPIIVAGSPLSYWAGVLGKYPMRYSGGLLGGSWLTALTSDIGGGKFDGAWLVQNFENQNPSNTFWSKQYNLYSKVDTEAERYLGFERWWGGHVDLNAAEIQFIVDRLFIGNDLAAGRIQTSDGTAIDLRSIRSPIVVFCSHGDNITPPQQALHWVLDLYDSIDEIRSYGQTIVYTIHDKAGHLGLFVSSGVAKKEHRELSSNIDLIDTLPPGLYEAVFEKRTEGDMNPDLVTGDWIMRCEARTLDDLRALGGNNAEDERRFEAATKLSEINLALYRTFAQPFVRLFANPFAVEMTRDLHPLRLQYEFFSDKNPAMGWVKRLANDIRRDRKAVPADNPYLQLQNTASEQIERALDGWRDFSEAVAERTFLSIYGSPLLQVSLGLDPQSTSARRKVSKSVVHRQLIQSRIAELKSRISTGGIREAIVRSVLYVGAARASVDERAFENVRRLRDNNPEKIISLSEFKQMIRNQFLMLVIDQEASLAALSSMLPADGAEKLAALALTKEILNVRGPLTGAAAERLAQIETFFAHEQPSSPQFKAAS
jgi:pimeloyl-ACP methyl ester carboxylesterase